MNPADIGKLINGSDQERDAIHVPVIPAVCGMGEKLNPGQLVGIDDGENNEYHTAVPASSFRGAMGIVDPFLRDTVVQGEKFWILVKPGSVLNLTHSWSHEDFPDLEKDDNVEDDYNSGCRGCY